MATKKKVVAGGKVYKGSKQNGGREIVVKHYKKDGEWKTTTVNAAREQYEKKHGKIKSKSKTVDHKNNNHSDNRDGNLQILDKGANTAKENKRRAHKKGK
jgi:hypothetical protein